jgi:hypothetical protein
MRYIKKLALYNKDPVDDKFSVYPSGRIITNSLASQQLPSGTRDQRYTPEAITDGTIRYNQTLNEFEVYNSMNGASPYGPPFWEIVRTIRPATITPQTLGYGNYDDTIFGPLAYDVNINAPQNVLVFVDNVYQIPNTNYTLITNPNASTSTTSAATGTAVTTLYLNTLSNIDIGQNGIWRTVSASGGIQAGTTVTNVSNTYSYAFHGWPISISLPTTAPISSGTVISVSYTSGVYVQFTSIVPNKAVFVLLGFDGYFPAGPLGNLFES